MMEINEDIYGLEKSVLHKLILIQIHFSHYTWKSQSNYSTRREMGKSDVDFFNLWKILRYIKKLHMSYKYPNILT